MAYEDGDRTQISTSCGGPSLRNPEAGSLGLESPLFAVLDAPHLAHLPIHLHAPCPLFLIPGCLYTDLMCSWLSANVVFLPLLNFYCLELNVVDIKTESRIFYQYLKPSFRHCHAKYLHYPLNFCCFTLSLGLCLTVSLCKSSI